MKLRLKWIINVLLQLLVVVFLVQCHGVQGGLLSRLLPVWSHYGNQATGSRSHNSSSSSSSIRQLLSVHTAATASGKRYAAEPAGPLARRFPTIAHSGRRPADTAASDLADSGGSEDEAAAEESEASSTFATAEDTADSKDAVLSQTAHPSTSAADRAEATQGARDSSTTAESTPATEAADMSINDDADAGDSSNLRNVSANVLDTAMADVNRHKARLHKQLVKPAWCSKAQGKVSRVECWTDQQGVITGIQLTDDAGMHQPGICSIGQGPPSGGGVLHEFESIVEVKACKAHALSSHHAYSYMEIWTDGGRAQPITCGTMQAGSKCEVINSGKTPRWAQPAAKPGHKWFKQQGYTPDKYIINGQVYEKVSTFDPYAGVTGSDPAYFREVFPLSELKATCNKHGHLSRLESACWNKQYKPKPREVLLDVKLTMDDFYTCPKKADEMHPMVCYVSDAVREMLYKQGIEVKAKIAPVECKSDMFSNTTISFIAKLNALNFKSHGLFSAKVMHSIGGDELCDSHNSLACDQHGIFDWEVEQMYKAPKGVKWLQGVCTPKPLPALPLGDGYSAGTPAQGYSPLLQPTITAPQPYKQPALPGKLPMVPPPGYINTGPIIQPPLVHPPTHYQPPRVPAPDGRAPVPRHEPAPVRTTPQPQLPFIEYVDPQPLPPFIGQEDREEDRLLEREAPPRILPPIQRQTPPIEQQTPFNGDDVGRQPWQPMPGPVARPPVRRGPAPTPAPLEPQMPFIEYVDPQLSVPSSDTILEGTAPQQSPWLLGVNDGFFSDIQSPDYDDADTTPPVMPQQPLLQPVLQQPAKTLLTPLKQQQQPKVKPRAQPLSPPSQPGPRLQPVLGVPERSAWQNPKPQPNTNPNPKVQPKPQQKLHPQQQQTKQKPRAPLPQQQQGVAKGSPQQQQQQQQLQQLQQPWLFAQPQQKPVLTRQQPKLQRQQTKQQQPGLVQQQHQQKPRLQQPQQQVRPVQQLAPQQSGWKQQPQSRPVQQPTTQQTGRQQQQQPSQQRPRQQPTQQMQQQPQKQKQQQQQQPRPNAPQSQPIAQQPRQAHHQQQQQQQPPVVDQVARQQQVARPPQKQQSRRKPRLQQQQEQQLWTQPPPPPQQQPLAQQGAAVGLGAGVRPQSGGQHLQPGSTSAQKAKQQQRAKQLTKQKQQQQRSSQQGQQPPLYQQQQQQLPQRPQAALQAPGSTQEQLTVRNGQQSGHLQAMQPPPLPLQQQQQQQQRSQRQHTPLQQQQQQQHAPQQHHKQHHKQIGTVRMAPEAPSPQHGTPRHQQDSGWSPTDASSSQAVWKTGPAARGSSQQQQQQQQQLQPQQSLGDWGSWLLSSLGKVAGAFAQSSAASMSSR